MKKICVTVALGLLVAIMLVSNAVAARKYWDPMVAYRTQDDILKRFDMNEDVKSKVDTVYSEYKNGIDGFTREIMDIGREIIVLGFSTLSPDETQEDRDTAMQAAEAKRDDELFPKLNAVVAERDAKIREVLPSELQAKFDRAKELITEWDTKRKAILEKYDRKEEVTEADKAYEDEFEQKINAELGLKR